MMRQVLIGFTGHGGLMLSRAWPQHDTGNASPHLSIQGYADSPTR